MLFIYRALPQQASPQRHFTIVKLKHVRIKLAIKYNYNIKYTNESNADKSKIRENKVVSINCS